MFNNPEFQRFIWVKFSAARVATSLMLLGLVALIVGTLPKSDAENFVETFGILSYLFIHIWGVYDVANVFGRDTENRTWDFQKMSPVTSMRLLLGKIFGASSFAWFLGLSCFFVSIFAALLHWPVEHHDKVFHYAFLFVIAGVFGQITAFYTSILGYNEKIRRSGVVAFILGVLASSYILDFAKNIFDPFRSKVYSPEYQSAQLWYDMAFDPVVLGYMSVAFFTFWIFVGAHQVLRDKLQYNDPPLVWLGFVVSFSLYSAGFISADNTADPFFYVFFIGLLLTYITMVQDSARLNLYTAWLYCLCKKDYAKAFEKTPKWIVSLGFVVLAYMASIVFYDGKMSNIYLAFYALCFLLFFARDALVLHGLRLGRKSDGNRFGLWVYYLLVYLLLPWLVATFMRLEYGWKIFSPFRAMDSDKFSALDAMSFFFPIKAESYFVMLAPIVIQVIIAGLFLRKRLNTLKTDM